LGKEAVPVKLITEADVRAQLNESAHDVKEFRIEPGAIITPAAREYLMDRRVKLVAAQTEQVGVQASVLPDLAPPKQYKTASGEPIKEKPEHMTSLRGAQLVRKDHPVIRFRGAIDSMTARILEVQLAMDKLGLPKLALELEEILSYVREILRAEVREYPLEFRPLLGMSAEELREKSHHPEKYFGLNHFAPRREHGEAVILLNTLRTQIREVELAAYDAFKGQDGVPTRGDIILALNRLSSLLYVMMFRALTKEYD
jgi:ethanolamine utilization cobalamin adenosyltransferase